MSHLDLPSLLNRGAHWRRDVLKTTPIEWPEVHQGVLRAGPAVANVGWEPDESLRIEMPVAASWTAPDALRLIGKLPGNLRLAIRGQSLQAVADLRLDDIERAPSVVQELRATLLALAQTEDASALGTSPSSVSLEALRTSVQALDWPDDAIVDQQDRWELRVRLDHECLPVRLQLDERGVVLRRTIVDDLRPETMPPGMSVEAMQRNARVRHARLALVGGERGGGELVAGELVAEARLTEGLVTPASLAHAALAVAATSRFAQGALELLARQRRVHDFYAWVFAVRPDGTIGA